MISLEHFNILLNTNLGVVDEIVFILRICVCICVHEFMLVCAHTHAPHTFRCMKIPKEAIRSLTSRALDSYEPPDTVAKSQNPVLCKSSKYA